MDSGYLHLPPCRSFETSLSLNLGWRFSNPHSSSCLCLLSTEVVSICLLSSEITSTPHHSSLSPGCWGSELRSPCLRIRTFLNEPAPQMHVTVGQGSLQAPLAHLVQAAATSILQVTQVELQHLSLQLAELDARLLHKSSVDLLYLLCGKNGSEQKDQRRGNSCAILDPAFPNRAPDFPSPQANSNK